MSSKSGENKEGMWRERNNWFERALLRMEALNRKEGEKVCQKYFEAVKKESLFKDTWERRKEVKLINARPLFCQDIQLLNAPIFELCVILLNIKPIHAQRIATCCLYFRNIMLAEDICTNSVQSYSYTHLPEHLETLCSLFLSWFIILFWVQNTLRALELIDVLYFLKLTLNVTFRQTCWYQ